MTMIPYDFERKNKGIIIQQPQTLAPVAEEVEEDEEELTLADRVRLLGYGDFSQCPSGIGDPGQSSSGGTNAQMQIMVHNQVPLLGDLQHTVAKSFAMTDPLMAQITGDAQDTGGGGLTYISIASWHSF